MSSVLVHMGIGVLIAELLLRAVETDPECVIKNRLWYWLFGALGGLIPDLDVVPALITGEPWYTYHHIYTHTFWALGIMMLIAALMKFHPLAVATLLGYGAHLLVDFFDNTIPFFSPFDQTRWGLNLSSYFIARGWYVDIYTGFAVFSTSYLEVVLNTLALSIVPFAMRTLARASRISDTACEVDLAAW